MESQAHQNLAPRRQALKSYSQAVRCNGVMGTTLRVYRTAFAWSPLQQRERQWQRAYQRRPTALGAQEEKKKKKTTETETCTLNTGNSSRVHSLQAIDSRENLDANQSN